MRLTSSRLLAGNVIWNLVGQLAPMLAAIVAIPILIHHIGIERFGILSLAWVLIGYFSLFDFGMGRALTKLLAERISLPTEAEVPALSWTALLLMTLFGLIAAGLIISFSHAIVGVLNISEGLRNEAERTFVLLGATIPLVIITTGLRGVLEAYQAFRVINLIRIPLGIYTYAGPLLVLPFATDLPGVILILAFGRIVGFIVHLLACLRTVPALKCFTVQRSFIRPLLSFGGWMTVTNIVSPLMVYMDRFLIGAIMSATAVAYYSTPYEMIVKLQVLPIALVTVLFPAFSMILERDPHRAADLYFRSIIYVITLLFPIVLLFIVFSEDMLRLWLGDTFANESRFVLQMLAIAQLVNGVARVPFALIQGAGRPAITALFHVIELLFYIPIIYWLASNYGNNGVAISFLVRVAGDLALLYWGASRYIEADTKQHRCALLTFGLACLVLAVGALPSSFHDKIGFVGLVLLLYMFATWFLLFDEHEKKVVRQIMRLQMT